MDADDNFINQDTDDNDELDDALDAIANGMLDAKEVIEAGNVYVTDDHKERVQAMLEYMEHIAKMVRR